MKKFIILAAAIFIVGCTSNTTTQNITLALEKCQDKGGIKSIKGESVVSDWSEVYCKDGAKYTISKGKILYETR